MVVKEFRLANLLCYLRNRIQFINYFMESSERSPNNLESPHHRWAGVLGTVVAIMTLILPLLVIAYYSPFSSNAEPLPEQIRSLPNTEN
ncbi:MAG: hypothetical protein Kow0049_04490 [Stanieria sp.]|jgi:Trk-type K+ transport system membrane component